MSATTSVRSGAGGYDYPGMGWNEADSSLAAVGFSANGMEDVKDCLYFLTWEIAEDRTLEAWDGQMQLAIMEVTPCSWR